MGHDVPDEKPAYAGCPDCIYDMPDIMGAKVLIPDQPIYSIISWYGKEYPNRYFWDLVNADLDRVFADLFYCPEHPRLPPEFEEGKGHAVLTIEFIRDWDTQVLVRKFVHCHTNFKVANPAGVIFWIWES